MRRVVRVLQRAQQDVASFYAYIAERSPQGADSWFNQFADTRDRLSVNAEARALAAENEFVDYDIRQVLFKTRKGRPYRVLFTIAENEVLILRVRGPGQEHVTEAGIPKAPSQE